MCGISQADGAEIAQIEYTYRWNPTDFAQKLGRIPDGVQIQVGQQRRGYPALAVAWNQ